MPQLDKLAGMPSTSSPPIRRGFEPLLPLRFVLMGVLLFLLGTSSGNAAELLWFRDGRLTPQAHEMLEVLRAAEDYGLRSHDYSLPFTEEQMHLVTASGADPTLRAKFDAALTATAAKFLSHVQFGRVSPRALGFNLPVATKPDATLAVRETASVKNVRRAIAEREPPAKPYRLLKQALADYRKLANMPLPKLSPPKRSVRPGDEYPEAPLLRELLYALGDLPEAARTNELPLMDDELTAALERFQDRHRLEVDGVLGPRTYAALSTPMSVRVRQIELTLERWRWTAGMTRPDIVVNIPHFMLYALPRNEGDETIEMRVVVGQTAPNMRTPIFTAQMKYVVFQPYWDVPRSIVLREQLPRIRKDPTYLERNQMELVCGQSDNSPVVPATPEAIEELAAGKLRLRQRPGPQNSLGPVKFMLPNPYNVYLHATPATELFNRSRRAFSHGCVRVSDPARLAEYVLKNAREPWDSPRIEEAMCGSKTFRVDLVQPLTVMMFYGTAAATETQGVLFAEDLYGHDKRLEEQLAVDS